MESGAAAEPEPELVVYESVDLDSSSGEEPDLEHANDDIVTSTVSPEAALEAFAEPAHRVNDTVSARVARLRREIEELRRDGAQKEATDLLEELRRALDVKKPAPEEKAPEEHEPPANQQLESQAEFADLEARVATLELRFGTGLRSSRAPESLASSVGHLKQTVELLASNPDSVTAILNRLKGPESAKTGKLDSQQSRLDTLYYRLQALDGAIEALPHVVSRLQTLRYVHTEALHRHEQLKDIQRAMDSMEGDLRSWRATLERVENRVNEYINVSQQNINKLHS